MIIKKHHIKNRCPVCGRIVGSFEHVCPEKGIAHVGQFKKGMVPWNKGKKYGKKWGHLNTCLDCGKQVSRPGYIRCQTCSNKYRSGERSSNWRGGITPMIKRERAKFREEVKKSVFERDNYTCQLCGVRSGLGKDVYLQVDHIQSWKDYVELRFSMKNCRTLCMSCHYKVTFGKPMPVNIKFFGYNKKTRRVQKWLQ